MGGLLAAKVLADHFEHVTVIDRDVFPETPEHRKGVPQSQHAHGFLARGQGIVEGLFPGLTAELRAGGAVASGSLTMVSPKGKLLPPTFEGEGAFASRFFLEWNVHRRLLALSNVQVISATDVVNLTASADKTRVTGVVLRRREGSTAPSELQADLVVDVSGRQSKAGAWLERLGYNAPPQETITSDIGYASRFYEKPADFPGEWAALIINGRPPHNPRAGLILPIEDDKWHVTVGGFASHYPPIDEAGFMAWARELPDPSLYEAIRVARPLTPIRGYRTPVNHLRHFERMERRPRGFIVMGDAVCAFNPIYGQGMTVAALEALDLQAELESQKRRPTGDFERRFQKRVAKTVAAPWSIATGEDLRWEGVRLEGTTHRDNPVIRRYMNLLLEQGRYDGIASNAFHRVTNLLAPPSSLLAPRLALRVLRGALIARGRTAAEDFALSAEAVQELRARRAPQLDLEQGA